MSEPARFQLKRDYIVERLRTAITNGELKPGQKLRQEELATRFQISSTPVREALRKLEAEGLVTSVPHQGVYVARLSAEEAEERYLLRTLLEAYAVKEAVTSLQNDPARRDRALADLKQHQTALVAAIKDGRYEDAAQCHDELHLRLYDEARSPLLKQTVVDLWKKSPFSRSWPLPGPAKQVEAEYEELFDAIRAGDATAAEQMLRMQIDRLACLWFLDDWMRRTS